MILPPRLRNIACLPVSLGSLAFLSSAYSQDFTRQLAGAERFFDVGILPENLAGLLDPTLDGTLKGVVGYNLSVGATYDSNVNLSDGNEQDDIFFFINPSVFYSSDPEGGARHAITAFYSPNPQISGEGSRNRFNHNGGVSYRFNGSKTSITAFLNLAQQSGADRFAGGYSEGTLLSYGIKANYQLAPRTSVYASMSGSHSTYSTSGQQGGDSFAGMLGANWTATERLSIGPSLRFTSTESDRVGKRTAFGLLFNANYNVTELISVGASLGLESVRESGFFGGNELSPTGGLNFSYRISPIWTWGGDISYAHIPSPSNAGIIVNDLRFSTSLGRQLDVGSMRFFASYSISDNEPVGFGAAAGVANDDGNHVEIGVGYSRPFISDRVSFSTSVSYQSNESNRDWSKWLWSVSWGTTF